MITENLFKKYNSFDRIKETEKYYIIYTKIPMPRVHNIILNKILKIRKDNYKITVSLIRFKNPCLFNYLDSKDKIFFSEYGMFYNYKRDLNSALKILNDFFERSDNILEKFI